MAKLPVSVIPNPDKVSNFLKDVKNVLHSRGYPCMAIETLDESYRYLYEMADESGVDFNEINWEIINHGGI